MKFLADECCEAGLVQKLRADHHDVLFAVEDLQGAPDAAVLDRAAREQRILLTEDKDFGVLVYRLRRPAHGVVLLRFAESERASKWPRLRGLIRRRARDLGDAYVVLEADKTRIRPLSR